MKKLVFLSTLTLALFSFSCNSGNTEKEKNNTQSDQVNAEGYQCPMKCEGDKIYSEPGSCPVCNMDLEVVEAK